MINMNDVAAAFPAVTGLQPIARGGQKIVFRGVHQNYGDVVVKLLLSTQTDPRIKREIEIATNCQIPNTAQLYESGSVTICGNDVAYLIEEFIQGETLRQVLRREGRLSLAGTLALLESLLDTAIVMEQHDLVHRDVKPENIMVCQDGSYRLLDFGIARHLAETSITPSNAHFGPHTAGYAAPEQFRNLKREIDIRADLFALGVVAYECLSGQHPFCTGARDKLDILRRTENLIPPQLQIPGTTGSNLASFIAVMMDKYASRRPQSAAVAKKWFDGARGVARQ